MTYQVRPFTVPLLHTGTSDEKKKKKQEGGKSDFSLHAEVWITLIFFLLMEEKKKETGAVGMKVNNMHEFVKKINNAAFVG